MSEDIFQNNFAYQIAHGYAFSPFDDGKFEPFNPDEDTHWAIIADKPSASCLRVKFKPEELPQAAEED